MSKCPGSANIVLIFQEEDERDHIHDTQGSIPFHAEFLPAAQGKGWH